MRFNNQQICGVKPPLIAVVLFALIGGCRFDPDDNGALTPPLFVRSTVPSDSTAHVFSGQPISLTIFFSRSTSAEEFRVRLAPAPLSFGEWISSTSGRSMTWLDLMLESDVVGYRLLIDGPSIPEPELLMFHPGRNGGAQGRIAGWIKTQHPSRGKNAIVFALREDPPDVERPHLELFLGRPLESMATVLTAPSLESAVWAMAGLEGEVAYRLVAILDTSGDGEYHPASDWTGVSTAIARTSPFSMVTDLRIEILPPGWVDFSGPSMPLGVD